MKISKKTYYRESTNEWVVKVEVKIQNEFSGIYMYTHKTKFGAYFNIFWFGYSMIFDIIKIKLNIKL